MSNTDWFVNHVEGVTLVSFPGGAVLDETDVSRVGEELLDLVRRGCSRLVIDFTGLGMLSSRMLGLLVCVDAEARARGGALVVCGLHPQYHRAVKVTRLDEKLHFVPDASAALDLLRADGGEPEGDSDA